MGVVSVSGVKFSYGKKNKLLEYPDITFVAGKGYAIVGGNGCGKTTLLKLILGILKPNEGKINGIKNEIIGFVPDYNGLYSYMTILENIRFRLSLYERKYEDEKEYILDLLKKYNLENEQHKMIKELSLGMCKKVSIICALIVKPTVLVLDEPTSGLDADAQKELVEVLKQYIMPDNMVICTSHDSDFLDRMEYERIFLNVEKKEIE